MLGGRADSLRSFLHVVKAYEAATPRQHDHLNVAGGDHQAGRGSSCHVLRHQSRYALQLPELPRTPQCLSDRATVSLNEATSVTPHTNVTARRLLRPKFWFAPPRLTGAWTESASMRCTRHWARSRTI